ncbi:MAG: hypothetical protein ACT6FC_02160 [Methanosarcinaceae archaeon]
MKRVYANLSDQLHARLVKFNEAHTGQELKLSGVLEKALDDILTKEGY